MNNMVENVQQENNCKLTFWQLLSTYKVEIPIIQRDYAQGRLSENATAIRGELLESIYDALVYDMPLDFDFVYGSVEENKLFPLDGQQRLTTLFLLHWYLAEKENRIEEMRKILSNFSYTTRISSRDFCEMLVDLTYSPQKNIPVSKYIKNENKYFLSWNSDPTVKAMLVMLDAIHERFFECEPLLDKLLDEKIITFNYLPMEHYALTDDLYIKMNARGKPLSIFENFKAKFIQHLRDNHLPYGHFEESIDGKWIDLLWDYRAADNTIDKQFMRLFRYCTEMIFLWTETPKECESPFRVEDIRKLVEYYDSAEKVNILYSLMDLWANKQEVETYLTSLLSIERVPGKVRLFDGSTELFSDIVNGNRVTVTNQILLFSIMQRLIKLGKDTDESAMLDYIRIVRNFLIKNRFFSSLKAAFTPDFRFGRNGIPYTSFFLTYLACSENPYETIQNEYSSDYVGVNEEIYKQESKKANIILSNPEIKSLIQGLEDLSVFKGSIFNILDYVVDSPNLKLIDDIETLFIPENSDDIIAALLSISDYGVKLGGSFLGDRYFYGNKDRWYEVISYSGGAVHRNTIVELIQQFGSNAHSTITEKLQDIAKCNLSSIDKDDWRYCLVKYPSTIKELYEITNRNVVFVFEKTGSTTILHRMNGSTLNAKHVVPEYIEAIRQLGKDSTTEICGQNSDDLGSIKLTCRQGLSVSIANDGNISVTFNDEDEELVNEALAQFNIAVKDDSDTVEQLVLLANILKDTMRIEG